jgi:hypothetical protein
MTTPNDKNLDVLEGIFHEAALVEAEDGEATPEDKRWATAVRTKLEQRVAAMRATAMAKPKPSRPIRDSYLAMARDALIARIEELIMGGRVQVAHRNLSKLSDDDLRRLLESLDPDSD